MPKAAVYVALLCASLLLPLTARAFDLAIIHAPLDEKDHHQEYIYEALERALFVTKESYGNYKMKLARKAIPRDRQFTELLEGKTLTVITSAPKANWTGKTLRVPFPIQKGIGSYRIFLIMEENKDLLKHVTTLGQLKLFSTGANVNWSTTKILKDHGFNTVDSLGYKNLFNMLSHGRFQTFNRGVNEVAKELEIFGKDFPSLTYDKHVLLYTYLPNYFYVTPKQPRLAQRIEFGLKKMHQNGELDKLFNRYYGPHLAQFELQNRRVFEIENTNLESGWYEHDKPYLLKH
ncbi:hypothetical protein SAMN02745866_01080 [Alteromonadaceae bacterium Bs31]|nr:hypothetical protein SAMN02745866_01080 [Alteromonadaceae bacterium Bs31]